MSCMQVDLMPSRNHALACVTALVALQPDSLAILYSLMNSDLSIVMRF